MASLYSITLLILIGLTLHLGNVSADILHPHLGKQFHNVCSEVSCGKGNCKSTNDKIFGLEFGFECECDPGWKQAFKFMPCVIPNCTLNYSCGGVPTPAPVVNKKDHKSVFDACHWVDCGGGICNKTSTLGYTCECHDGYSNLLNVKAFPCFKPCTLGMDCGAIGIDLLNGTTPPASNNFPDTSRAKDSFIVGGGFDWLITIAASIAAIYVFV